MHVCMYVCMYICMHVNIWKQTYIDTQTHTYIHIQKATNKYQMPAWFIKIISMYAKVLFF